MMRRRLLISALASLALPVLVRPAVAAPLSLAQISDHIRAIGTAAAPFTQINPDGSLSTGRMWLRRPGRARFEYDPPNEGLVIAGGGQVAIFDSRSNTGPQKFPLRRTPLDLFLGRNPDLARSGLVLARIDGAQSTTLVLQDPDHADQGTIALEFSNAPVALLGWVVTDALGDRTEVRIGDWTRDLELGNQLFSITHEENDRR